MNPTSVINFAKTPVGGFLAFCIVGSIALVFFKGCEPSSIAMPSFVSKAAAATSGQTVQSFGNDNFSGFNVPPVNPSDRKSQSPGPRSRNYQAAQPEVLPLSLYAETPAPEPKELSQNYAPYGRLIPCELVITVDSSTIQTPIVGLVTEDIYHEGRLIIPAGTEVHGTAQTDRARDRIASGNNWVLVWHTGEELRLKGIALDRDASTAGQGWGITDGSAGLCGRIIKTDNMAEIKLFAASFLSGAANLLAQREQTLVGTMGTPSVGNAGLEGAQSVIGAYAQQIYQSIQQNGFYVRVPAGKQFYLYVTQTIDKADAIVGGAQVDRVDSDFLTNQPNTVSVAPPNYAAALWSTNAQNP